MIIVVYINVKDMPVFSRKAEKKLVVMDRKMGTVKEKEMIATETLKQVLSVVSETLSF